MGKIIDYILSRLSEDSTWRGIIALLTAVGVSVKPDMATAIISAGLGLIGAINVFRKQA